MQKATPMSCVSSLSKIRRHEGVEASNTICRKRGARSISPSSRRQEPLEKTVNSCLVQSGIPVLSGDFTNFIEKRVVFRIFSHPRSNPNKFVFSTAHLSCWDTRTASSCIWSSAAFGRHESTLEVEGLEIRNDDF